MSESCEFVLVPRKLTVRDLVTPIGNNTSEQDSIECWRYGEFGDGSFGSTTLKGTQRYARLSGYKNKFETKMSVPRRKSSARMLQQCAEQNQSLLLCYSIVQIARLVFYGPWIPHSTTR